MTALTAPHVLDIPSVEHAQPARPAGPAQPVGGAPASDPTAFEDLLARGYRDDAARHPRRRPLRWRVLSFPTDGVVAVHDLVPLRNLGAWLRGTPAPLHLVERPSGAPDTITMPVGLRGYAAVVLVEHAAADPETDAHRLLAAGYTWWRMATAAGYDAALVAATSAVPGDHRPVVGVGLCRVDA